MSYFLTEIGGASALNDLDDVTIDGSTLTNEQLLQYEQVGTGAGMWKNKTVKGGHLMRPDPEGETVPTADDVVNAVNAALVQGGTNDYVPSLFGMGSWSNCEAKYIYATFDKDDDGVGTWEDDDVWKTSGVRTGWMWAKDLYRVLEDENGNRNLNVEVIPAFDIGDEETASLYAYRIDDEYYMAVTPAGTENPQEEGWYERSGTSPNYTYSLTTDTTVQAGKTYYAAGGAMAIKLNGKVKTAGGITAGVKLVYQRTEVIPATLI